MRDTHQPCGTCGGSGWIYDPMKVQRETCDKSYWGQLSCRPCPDCQPEGELAKELRAYASAKPADWEEPLHPDLVTLLERAAARIDELEKACRWIPVSERLPAERHGNHHSEWVVATDGKDWTIAEYNRAHGSWLKDHSPHDLDMGPVTHWKPIILPAALGEKTDENQR
jgi:hypothetical protein